MPLNGRASGLVRGAGPHLGDFRRDRSALVLSVVRSARWVPFGASVVLGTAVVVVPVVAGVRLEVLDVTSVLHLSLVVTLLGAALALDDPLEQWGRSQPVPSSVVAVIRMALASFVTAGAWSLQLSVAPHLVPGDLPYPVTGLVIEPFGLLAWTWVVALRWGRRDGKGVGSVAAAPFLVLASIVVTMLPERLALFVTPGAPEYDASRARWAVVLATGFVVLLVVVLSGHRRRLGSRR